MTDEESAFIKYKETIYPQCDRFAHAHGWIEGQKYANRIKTELNSTKSIPLQLSRSFIDNKWTDPEVDYGTYPHLPFCGEVDGIMKAVYLEKDNTFNPL